MTETREGRIARLFGRKPGRCSSCGDHALLSDYRCGACAAELAAHPGVAPRVVLAAALVGSSDPTRDAEPLREAGLKFWNEYEADLRQGFVPPSKLPVERQRELGAKHRAQVDAHLAGLSGRWAHTATEALKDRFIVAKFGVPPRHGHGGCMVCGRARSKRNWVYSEPGVICMTCASAPFGTDTSRTDNAVADLLGVEPVEGLAARVLGVRPHYRSGKPVSLRPWSHISRDDMAKLKDWAASQHSSATPTTPLLSRTVA